jgi:hypothetical protein
MGSICVYFVALFGQGLVFMAAIVCDHSLDHQTTLVHFGLLLLSFLGYISCNTTHCTLYQSSMSAGIPAQAITPPQRTTARWQV